MTERYYPPLEERNINIVSQLYEADAAYFEDPACPYSKGVIEIFKGTSKAHDFDGHGYGDEVPDADSLISQINALNKQLHVYGKDIQNGGEDISASDRNTYFRLSVTLLEKLLDMKKEISNIKEYESFIAIVLDFMDKELTPDKRNMFMLRVEGLTGGAVSTFPGTETNIKDA